MTTTDRIAWSEALATGVDEIDRQHRILVNILAEAEALHAGERAGVRFEQIFRDLLAYAIYHFETEEELMRAHRYADADADAVETHVAQHRDFSARVARLRGEMRREDPASREALVGFLRDWLVNHIQYTDKALARHLLAAAKNPASAG